MFKIHPNAANLMSRRTGRFLFVLASFSVLAITASCSSDPQSTTSNTADEKTGQQSQEVDARPG